MENCMQRQVDDYSKAILQVIIQGEVDLESIIHSDGWSEYDGLVDIDFKKHYCVEYSKNEFFSNNSHINGIEGFWSFAKTCIIKAFVA